MVVGSQLGGGRRGETVELETVCDREKLRYRDAIEVRRTAGKAQEERRVERLYRARHTPMQQLH